MTTYAIRRILYTIPVLLVASFIIFFLLHLAPGDPAFLLVGPEGSDAQIEATRERLGLDQPIPVQYVQYMGRLFRGDLGRSFYYKEDIMTLILGAMPATLELSFLALSLALVVAIPAGVLSALRRNTWLDHINMGVAVVARSIPVFWLGIMLIYLFAVGLDWLPASGRAGPVWMADGRKHLVLPVISLGTVMMASTTRLTRAAMLEVLQEDYMRTARAKGMRERNVIFVHGLRNALIPVVTNVGLQVGSLLGGSFLTETVFAWPGIGRLSVGAMLFRDYPVIQATMLMVVFFFVVVNLLVDLLYGVLDPRISYQ